MRVAPGGRGLCCAGAYFRFPLHNPSRETLKTKINAAVRQDAEGALEKRTDEPMLGSIDRNTSLHMEQVSPLNYFKATKTKPRAFRCGGNLLHLPLSMSTEHRHSKKAAF